MVAKVKLESKYYIAKLITVKLFEARLAVMDDPESIDYGRYEYSRMITNIRH